MSSLESGQPVTPSALERELAILDFERRSWRHRGAKEEAIRDVFGFSAARYYQMLNAVIDSPDALRHDPMLIKRLQRARDARAHARAIRAFSSPAGRDNRLPHDETTD
ncbi:MAG: hypothetical protein JWM50_1268 [Microbacteriaceae bacterium]|jgi:hypothetical protein|nr:hypothetical protein [Microbacteriaceae bacterium]